MANKNKEGLFHKNAKDINVIDKNVKDKINAKNINVKDKIRMIEMPKIKMIIMSKIKIIMSKIKIKMPNINMLKIK